MFVDDLISSQLLILTRRYAAGKDAGHRKQDSENSSLHEINLPDNFDGFGLAGERAGA